MDILQHERQTYDQAWSVPAYAEYSPGEKALPIFLDMIGPPPQWHAASVLDAGCGSGKGSLALRGAGFDVRCCDLTPSGLPEPWTLPFHEAVLWNDLRPIVGFSDYVYCCDVLEHIPPPFTMLVISRLLDVARRGVFLTISLTPDAFGAWVGRPLHQTVQSFNAWRDQIAVIGNLVECRDLLNTGVYYVRPR